MKVTIVDGGFSTQLAHYVGDCIDGDPLWSARFLATAPQAVVQTHLDYLDAGAEVIITNSYQASIEGFKEYLGLDRAESFQLIQDSVNLAKKARDLFLQENPLERRPLIAGSVGSYGASLHDGSEYTGSFVDNTTLDQIKDWHRPRIQALLEAGVDILAIETIPALEEAEVLLNLIKEFPNARAWLSFQCQDGERLARGESFGEAVRRCWDLNKSQLVAVGCNCLDPNFVTPLIKSVGMPIPLVVYPNSGEKYSPDQGWSGKEIKPNLSLFVDEWLNLGVKFIGGCCRTDAKDIKLIKKSVKNWYIKNQ